MVHGSAEMRHVYCMCRYLKIKKTKKLSVIFCRLKSLTPLIKNPQIKLFN